ncbi:MAG: 3-methyl-2-oxobutanoate hydroxymethyltransferase [Phycisphaerae bacterium]|nr:3-methyl-2-oxobutanoate hydroxymethyltransferase [Phycisphaerae bacterium]
MSQRITLQTLGELKSAGRKFAMLTAYDFPTAQAAQQAGVHALLVGDSMGTVLLGHTSTRGVPLNLMVILAEAVRRGAPDVFLVGDLPHETMQSCETLCAGARRFTREAGCDAVKVEAGIEHVAWIAELARGGVCVIAHIGLRPQSVLSPDGYRAQARDADGVLRLVDDARALVDAGAAMLLIEAVPPDASAAVLREVSVPVIGCGAGPACDGHVVVTEDMLGLTTVRPPRFVPVHAALGAERSAAMRRWVEEIEAGTYPGPQHLYPMRTAPQPQTTT